MIEAAKHAIASRVKAHSPAPVTIRTFDFERDFTAVIDLWANAGPGIHLRRSDEPQEIQKKLQRDADLFLVAEVDAGEDHRAGEDYQAGTDQRRRGIIIGAVLGGFDGRRAMVYHLAVAEAHRKQGIAAQLMEALEDRLRARGCIRSYLLVTEDNLEAIRFYEAQDWKRLELFVYGKDLV